MSIASSDGTQPHTAARGSTGSVVHRFELAIDRAAIGQTDGHTGATLERLTFADGATLVVKRISPELDFGMRLTHDTGRAAELWRDGVLDRLPASIDHAILAVEPDRDGWVIAMRDVSQWLLGDSRVLTRAESRRILQAASAMHQTFRGDRIAGLCSLTDRYALLSPQMAARGASSNNPLPTLVRRGWERFKQLVPADVASAVAAIHERPALLAEQLERHPATLIHGDLWLANLGLDQDRVIVLDWGIAGWAPPAVEFASYLTGNWSRIAATREDLLDDFRATAGDLHEERTLRLALLGALVELGWNKALDAFEHPDATIRARESSDLTWWVHRGREALELWSPF